MQDDKKKFLEEKIEQIMKDKAFCDCEDQRCSEKRNGFKLGYLYAQAEHEALTAKLVTALEFYADRKNFQLIFDNEEESRAEVYEKYKTHSIGDLGVMAIEALKEFYRKE